MVMASGSVGYGFGKSRHALGSARFRGRVDGYLAGGRLNASTWVKQRGIRGSIVKRLHAVPARVVGWPTVAAAAALAVMAAGCSAGATARSATEARAAAPATLTIAPASGGHHVRPG